MQIRLNGRPVETEAQTLSDLVAERGYDRASVATALDGHFVARDRRDRVALCDGARVEIVRPMQGG